MFTKTLVLVAPNNIVWTSYITLFLKIDLSFDILSRRTITFEVAVKIFYIKLF